MSKGLKPGAGLQVQKLETEEQNLECLDEQMNCVPYRATITNTNSHNQT